MANGVSNASHLPPKPPRPHTLSQIDFTVKASSFAHNASPKQFRSPDDSAHEHWPSLAAAGAVQFVTICPLCIYGSIMQHAFASATHRGQPAEEDEDQDPASKFELQIQLGEPIYVSQSEKTRCHAYAHHNSFCKMNCIS